jgi:hypothetical protein
VKVAALIVGCAIGSRGEVPGERRPVIRDDDDKNNNTPPTSNNSNLKLHNELVRFI